MYLQKKIQDGERRCYKCHEVKALALFKDDAKSTRGKSYKCSSCFNLYSIKYREKNPDYFKEYRKKNKKRMLELHQEWVKKNPLKVKCYKELHYAIKKGLLIKQVCIVCSNLKAEAHHNDYDKPLDVIWLCRDHHTFLRRKHHHFYTLGAKYIMQDLLETGGSKTTQPV